MHRVSLVAQMVKNLPAMQASQVQSLGQEDPLKKGMETHSSILENSMDRGVWQAIVHGVTKSQTCTHRKEQLDISNCPGQTQKMDSFSVPDYGRILNRTCFYDPDKTESHITQPLDLTESNYYCTLVFKISWSDLCLLQKAFLS